MTNHFKILILILLSSYGFENVQAQYLNSVFGIGYGSEEFIYEVAIDHNGDRYILGGFVDSVEISPGVQLLAGSDYSPAFLMKVNKKNDLLWYKQLNVGDLGRSLLKTDKYGNVMLMGMFDGSIWVDGNPVVYSTHEFDIYVMKFSGQGHSSGVEDLEGTELIGSRELRWTISGIYIPRVLMRVT